MKLLLVHHFLRYIFTYVSNVYLGDYTCRFKMTATTIPTKIPTDKLIGYFIGINMVVQYIHTLAIIKQMIATTEIILWI